MKKTEKKHWQNGKSVRGGWFHQWAWTDDTYGVIIAWGCKKWLVRFRVYVYRLV